MERAEGDVRDRLQMAAQRGGEPTHAHVVHVGLLVLGAARDVAQAGREGAANRLRAVEVRCEAARARRGAQIPQVHAAVGGGGEEEVARRLGRGGVRGALSKVVR